MKKVTINDRGFIPLLGLVIILVVAIIAAGSIYYVARPEKATNTNVAVINASSNINRNTNVNSNATVNANSNINTNSNSNVNVLSNKVITVTSPVSRGQYAKNTIRVQGDTQANYQVQVYLGEVSCIDSSTYSGGGAGTANDNGHFDFLLNYQAYQGDSVSLVVAAVPDLSIYRSGTCVPNENQTEPFTINFSSSVSSVPADWQTYTNSTYGYSIQYPPDYIPSGTSEKYQFQKGNLQGDPTNTVLIYSLTAGNNRTLEDNEFRGETGWYDWAIAGFPNNGSTAARLSTNKRQETYGLNTFTVINYDPGSSANGMPFYYLVKGKTVYLITDFRVGTWDDATIHTMLASLTVND
jgi:hypothetical protein